MGKKVTLASCEMLLLELERKMLKRHRDAARSNEDCIRTIKEHTRAVYRLKDPRAQRAARWEDLESALVSLWKHRQREGLMPGDRRMCRIASRVLADIAQGGQVRPRGAGKARRAAPSAR